MTPRQKRMTFVGMLVVGVGLFVSLIMMALNENINHFFSPSEVLDGKAPVGHSFRIGGLVVTGSVKRDTASLKINFDLTDGAKDYPVMYVGILPDLFREGQGIVATGKLVNNVFVAEEVLAKHDENYMPPEVADALKKSGKWDQAKIDQLKHPENVPVGAGNPLPGASSGAEK
ncbi:Cytochrome c-type biogenesis protein CcmE, heme chaperone [hydrothermal vent metagenome]|uniref:Cytochrome c-type biogenesis protein CcmE, heme chaperone n=1 Tax=hydrothermal vent metagenome TaxID=652676 RepID=A0A3B0YJS3_9ZZZZ